jgi:hypothetical protein
MEIVECTSGVMLLKENVNHVTKLVPIVPDLKLTDVLIVSSEDSYTKEDVNLNAQNSSMLKNKEEPVNHVSNHVKNAPKPPTVSVALVLMDTIYMKVSVTLIVLKVSG